MYFKNEDNLLIKTSRTNFFVAVSASLFLGIVPLILLFKLKKENFDYSFAFYLLTAFSLLFMIILIGQVYHYFDQVFEITMKGISKKSAFRKHRHFVWADIESYKSSSVPGVKSKWMSEVPGIFEFRMKDGFKIKLIDEQSQLGMEFEKFILEKIKSFANSERMISDFNASKISGLKSDNKSSWLLIYCSILLIAALSSWQLYEVYKSFTFETQNPHIMADLNCVVQKGCNVEFEYNGVIVSRALSAREWSGIDRDASLVKIVVDAENPYRFKMLKDLKADKSRVVALLVLVVMLGSGLIFIKKIIRSRIHAMETLKKNFEKSSAN